MRGIIIAAALGAALHTSGAQLRPAEDEPNPDKPKGIPLPRGPNGIPDRVSLEEDSPFYFPDWKKIGVRFNGGDRRSVVEFCVSEGWLRTQIFHGGRVKRGPDGKSITNTLHGTIEPYWRS